MEKTRFFFSYARKDSEFVLKLAQDLRDAGANMWLDQLDILGGQRWDEAVQTALTSCKGMIIVLSPDAVASHNVMDEVSYALEAEKQIIPVLYRDCPIPFRLRRVQHVDFITDYAKGLEGLLRALRLGEPTTNGKSFVIENPVTKKAEWEAQKPSTDLISNVGTHHHSFRDRSIAAIVGAIVGAFIGTISVFIWADTSGRENWWIAALIAGIPGAIVGAISGSNRERRIAAIVGAIVGAFIGTISAFIFLSQIASEEWWIGALIVGIPGAIVGAISGSNRKVIAAALVGAIVGVIAGFVIMHPYNSSDIAAAIVYGVALGALVGAILGALLNRFKRLQ